MYIYNVTTNIEDTIHEAWVEWMKETHIPKMMDTGKFINAKMSKVLIEEDMGGITYSVQYTISDKQKLERYYQEDAPQIRADMNALFAGKFISFRTELEITHEHWLPLPTATHCLFTYGTLQEDEVQLSLFSRRLNGESASITGYIISPTKIANRYPTLAYTKIKTDILVGKVYVLTQAELEKVDQYEGEAYKRIQVVIESGKKVWAYIAH